MKQAVIFLTVVLFFSCTQPKQQRHESVLHTPEKMFRDSMAKYPDSLLFAEDLIQLFRDSNQYDQAIGETQKLLVSHGTNVRLYEILATLYFENEDTARAIAAYENAFELAPGPDYAVSLGTLYAYTGNRRALTLMDTLTQATPKLSTEADFIRGLYYSSTENYNKAISLFDDCLKSRLTFMEAYREKSLALFQLKKYVDALTVIERAITLQNNYEEGYYYKGRYLEKLNRPTEAAEAYQMALLYAPDYEEAREALNQLEK